MEKLVDNEGLMECIRNDPVIYVSSSKEFNAEKNITSAMGINN